MRRRDFIGGVTAAVTWPLASYAQEDGSIKRIGVLLPAVPAAVLARADEVIE